MNISRRDLLKVASTSGLIASGLAASEKYIKPILAQTKSTQTQSKKGEMLYRTLGSTGEEVSLIGLGGHHIGRPKDEEEGIRLIRSAIDRGINFMDNCWDYHNGGSELSNEIPSNEIPSNELET
jgi:hypothetical protein